MSIRRYSPSQIALHWLSAVAVLLIIALPYGADFFAGLLGGKGNVFTLHKSLGVAVLLLTLTRLALRRVQVSRIPWRGTRTGSARPPRPGISCCTRC